MLIFWKWKRKFLLIKLDVTSGNGIPEFPKLVSELPSLEIEHFLVFYAFLQGLNLSLFLLFYLIDISGNFDLEIIESLTGLPFICNSPAQSFNRTQQFFFPTF